MVSSLLMSFSLATVRVYATTAKGASGSVNEEKNPLDFVLGFMTKQDQFYETDPILKKTEEKEGTTGGRGAVRGGKKSAPTPVPAKKNDGGFGGIGGFFSKK